MLGRELKVKSKKEKKNMAKIQYFREGKLVVEEEKEEEYSEYKLDIIYSETFGKFYATIEELTTELRWIPKRVVSKELRIKNG